MFLLLSPSIPIFSPQLSPRKKKACFFFFFFFLSNVSFFYLFSFFSKSFKFPFALHHLGLASESPTFLFLFSFDV